MHVQRVVDPCSETTRCGGDPQAIRSLILPRRRWQALTASLPSRRFRLHPILTIFHIT